MRLLHAGLVFAVVVSAFGDTLRMKDGRTVNGTYLGGSARQVRVEIGDRIETLDVSDIDRIKFGGQLPPTPPPPPRAPAVNDRPPQASNDRPQLIRPEAGPPPASEAPG